ncbi:MAG TPA: ArsA family ATPase [Ktedonobacteraceae bacterium]|jgi:arsenite-transporting ATPase
MTLTRLSEESLQFILFGGKGGVGKTTMAAATALELSKEKKVLIFTTDPAPSLTDIFGQPVGDRPTPIIGVNNLFAMEINSKKVMQEFKEKYAKDILDILQQGTPLSNKETEEMFSLDIPGVDELMGLMKIAEFMVSADYQSYIVDTAPTGHTLRLLTMSDLLDNWIKFLASLRWKYHAIARAFGGAKRIEKADQLLLEMKRGVKKVKALLQSPERTEFVAVTIPEKMAMSETEDLVKSLENMRLASRHIIINNIIPAELPSSVEQWDHRGGVVRPPVERPFLTSALSWKQTLDFNQMRRRTQEKYVQEIKEEFSTHNITEVLLQPTEIQGVGSLQKLGAYLFSS